MKTVIVTVGPGIINGCGLEKIRDMGSYIYRINGAHGSPEHIEGYVDYILNKIPDAPILIDLPGNKIRTKNIVTPLNFRSGETLRFQPEQFNYAGFFGLLSEGMLIHANDGLHCFEVIKSGQDELEVRAMHTGTLTDNKGFYAQGVSARLPFLFERDLSLIEIAKRKGVKYLGLSFVRNVDDIMEAEKHAEGKCAIIAKLETASAVANMNSILAHTESVLIDRGDLAGDIGIENTPFVIEEILRRSKLSNNKVFIATQFLKYMENHPVPLLSEVNDLYNTMKLNLEGIQLSEETAIGQYPLKCLELINRVKDTLTKNVAEL